MKKRYLFFTLKLFVAGGLLFIVFKIIPYQRLLTVIKSASKLYVFLGFLFILGGHIIAALRWRFILKILNIDISIKEAIVAFISSVFFNLFFPSLVASDIFRSLAISYRFKTPEKIITSVIFDRISGVIALGIMAVCSLLLSKDMISLDKEVVLGIGLMGIASFILFFLLLKPKLLLWFMDTIFIRTKASHSIVCFKEAIKILSYNSFRLFKVVILFSLPLQLMTVISFFLSSYAFHLNVSFLYFLILVPLIMVISFLPITIGGIGTRELACIYFLGKIGIEKEISLGISLLNLFFLILVGIIGGIIYVMVYHRWLESGK